MYIYTVYMYNETSINEHFEYRKLSYDLYFTRLHLQCLSFHFLWSSPILYTVFLPIRFAFLCLLVQCACICIVLHMYMHLSPHTTVPQSPLLYVLHSTVLSLRTSGTHSPLTTHWRPNKRCKCLFDSEKIFATQLNK